MEMTLKEMGEYLKNLREQKGLSTREVFELSKVSNGYLSLVENGHRRASAIVLKKLASVYNVDYLDLYVKAGYADLAEYEKKSKNKTDELGNPVVSIPLLGTVKAGYDYLAEENIIDYVSVTDSSLNNNDFFALRVKGNSMVPEIYENDIAIVKKQDDFENGDYVVALVNGDEATIKKGYKTDSGLLLQPINQSIAPLIFDKETIKSMPVKIIGVVYNISRSFK